MMMQLFREKFKKLLDMKVIKGVDHTPGEYLSPIFIVPEKNGEYRMIINLKEFKYSISPF